MNMSDPVMRRAMFRQGGPVSSKGTGITSNVTTPEQNAVAMQTMLQPTNFMNGGPVQYFEEGGPVDAPLPEEPAPPTPIEALRAQVRTSEPRFRSVMDIIRQNREEGRTLPIDDEQAYTGKNMQILETRAAVANRGRGIEARAAEATPPEGTPPGGIAGFFGSVVDRAGEILGGKLKPDGASSTAAERRSLLEAQASDQMAERQAERMAAEDQSKYREGPAPAAAPQAERTPTPESKPPVKDRLTIRLEELKAEREANKAQRKENQLLALMQAGFAMAAGRSPSALANITAGGVAGVATLNDLEKVRRAEDTALRREIVETELAGEKMRESRAERQAGREQTAAQKQQTLLQNVSVNTRQEVSAINSTIANEEAKLLNPAVTEEQKAPIRSEIQRLKNQRDAAVEQMYSVYESMGIKRPKTPEQQDGGFKFLGAKK